MASKFPPFLAGGCAGRVMPFTPKAAQTFHTNELVVLDGTPELTVCGADPAAILGLALAPATASTIYADGKIPVLIIEPEMVIGMSSTTTPTAAMVNVLYGIAVVTNTWQVDTGDTSATRVLVVDVDIANGIFFVKFIAANLQLDAIAS